ncbi:MAG: hypothetical protein CSA35_09055 [Dethiosulfovibrio peptidovorans]|nr:MAG: hypothetical protein CSA35_09055 [Dethiosulfovibrio peptidovorans]
MRSHRELPLVPDVQNIAGIGRLGVIVAEEGVKHERTRGLAEQGASMIFWLGGHPKADIVTQSRVAENRVFVATARPVNEGESLIVSPDGSVLAQAFACGDQLISSLCLLGISREKRVVPGTHVLRPPH